MANKKKEEDVTLRTKLFKEVKKVVRQEDDKYIKEELKILFNNNTSHELFKDILVRGKPMYEPQTLNYHIKSKIIRGKLLNQLLRLTLMSNLKSIDRILFVQTRLKIIQLMKEVVAFDVAQGQEVSIPAELSQKSLPSSFRFYDPIIAIIYDGINHDRREQIHE
jgi:hypothetical protein